MAKKSKVVRDSGAVSSKNVTIKKASNGFVVSTWSGAPGRERVFIAKTQPQANKIASKLLK